MKQSNQSRKGSPTSVGKFLVKALSSIREKGCRATPDRKRSVLTGKELVTLGKLIHAWKDIVGIQLAHKTCPARLIKGKLFLTVSDSQWLQTLSFIKPRVIEKLKGKFPELEIADIVGRLGKISAEVEKFISDSEWPNWEEFEVDMPLEGINAELSGQIVRCRKKSLARQQGLSENGFVLCQNCKAAMTKSADSVCAVCHFNMRYEVFSRVKNILKDMPWLIFEEVLSYEPEIKFFEFEAIKSDLLESCIELVTEAGERLKFEFCEELFGNMKNDMLRAVMLCTGNMPDQVDLYDLTLDQTLDPLWIEYLAPKQEDGNC